MNPSERTLNLEQVTPLFSQTDVQSHQNFLLSLEKLNTLQRAKLCQTKRDELLRSFRSIECLFAFYSLVFQKHIPNRDDKEWNEFHKVAKEGSRRLNIILKVTLAWGNEVVAHYNFSSRCRDYCENLRAVAWHNNQCQPWTKVVRILNTSIRSRIQRNDGRSKVSDSCNPILPQDLAYAKDILKGNNTFVNEPIGELPEDYGFDRHGLIVRRRFAASNNDQDEFPTPTDPRSASQLSSQAQGDIARDCNVTPAPSGQGPPSPSSRLTTTPEAINFAAESQSSLRQCSTHTSPTEYNRSTSTPVPASSSAAPGLTANETSPQSSSSLVEISQSQSSISENHNQHECTSLTTLSAVPVVKTIGCNGASRLPVAFSPSSPSSKSRQRGSRSVESPCIISEPAVSPTSPSSSSISYRLLPSSPLATTKSHNSPEEFSHDAKSSIDTAIKEEPSQTVTVAFSSPVEVTNPTRSPSTDPNPAFSPPSLSMCSSLRHEANQTLTANSNCRMDGITKRAMPPHSLKSFEASTEGVRKRPGPNLHESSPKKQKGSCFVDGDRATALAVTPLHPLSSAPLLDQGTRLNDVVVNEYMHHIAEHYECCFANSFFLKGHKPEEQWKAEVGDPLKSDLVLMPVHDKNSEHWYLLAMYKFGNSLIVCFLDFFGPSPSRERMHEDTFASWVKYFLACGNKAPVKKKHVQVPHQTNAFDCGCAPSSLWPPG